MKTLEFWLSIAGWLAALAINLIWRSEYDKLNEEWSDHCKSVIDGWSDLTQHIIEFFAEPDFDEEEAEIE